MAAKVVVMCDTAMCSSQEDAWRALHRQNAGDYDCLDDEYEEGRKALRREGWTCNDAGDWCPECTEEGQAKIQAREWCDQCQAACINGVNCHERGCPNISRVRVDGEWCEPEPTCWECGFTADECSCNEEV